MITVEQMRAGVQRLTEQIEDEYPGLVVIVILAQPDPVESTFAMQSNTLDLGVADVLRAAADRLCPLKRTAS